MIIEHFEGLFPTQLWEKEANLDYTQFTNQLSQNRYNIILLEFSIEHPQLLTSNLFHKEVMHKGIFLYLEYN